MLRVISWPRVRDLESQNLAADSTEDKSLPCSGVMIMSNEDRLSFHVL